MNGQVVTLQLAAAHDEHVLQRDRAQRLGDDIAFRGLESRRTRAAKARWQVQVCLDDDAVFLSDGDDVDMDALVRRLVEIGVPFVEVKFQVFLSKKNINGSVLPWDTHTDMTESFQFYGHTGSVAALAFDPASSLLASGSFDTTMRVWKFNQADATTARRNRSENRVR